MNAKEKFNQVAEAITAEIIAELEKGNAVWKKSFFSLKSHRAHNYFSGRPYEGFNQFYLAYKAYKNNYPTAQYISFKQANELGGYIRKGEKSIPAIFWKVSNYATGKKNEVGEEETRKIFTPFMHYVFNIAQAEGIEFKPLEVQLRNNNVIDTCVSVVAEMPNAPQIKHRGNQPAYSLINDEVYMPMIGQFNNSESYSKEELIAEIGATQLCAYAGIMTDELKENSTAYLQGWIKALKNDSSLLITAANKAGKAAKFILNLLEQETEVKSI